MRIECKELNIYARYFLIPDYDFRTASNIAYMDMARHTLHFDCSKAEKEKTRDAVTKYLQGQIKALYSVGSQKAFDVWHAETCNGIMRFYDGLKGQFHYGQAQKWLNMLIKYLYVYNVPELTAAVENERIIEWFHVPIDNIVIALAWKNLNLPNPVVAWSKMSENDYLKYQEELQKSIRSTVTENADESIPFYWELIHWPKAKV